MTVNTTTLALFNKEIPICCFVDQLYDPDVDGTNPDASGKYVVEPGSFCVDRATLILYVVTAVDATTYKATLEPVRILQNQTDVGTGIVSYGNDLLMLYFDDRLNPTKLYSDGKIALAGLDNVEYQLNKIDEDGNLIPVSIYIDADGKYRGNRIPLTRITGTDWKIPTNCHTLLEISDGDKINFRAYNTMGVQSVEVNLLARRSSYLNDLVADGNPIVKFDMDCTQLRGDDFFVYAKQDPEHLNIMPYVVYANGVRRDIPVDNKICFLYGLTDYSPAFPGYKQPILAKLFLAPREIADIGEQHGKYRYLTAVRNLITVNNTSTYTVKLSIVPLWNGTKQAYELRWMCYINTRDHMWDVTDLVTDAGEVPFNGASYTGQTQKVTARLDLASLVNTDYELIHVQSCYLTLKPYTTYEQYVFKDGISDDYSYGVEAGDYRRPIIHYDADLAQYFIPSTIFKNTAAVLENFYYRARPPYDPDSSEGIPTPTHFSVRDVYGRMVIANPIPLEEYAQAWSIIRQSDEIASQYVGGSLIVEWWVQNGDQYEIIYGTPVQVIRSETGYNTETNNIYEP